MCHAKAQGEPKKKRERKVLLETDTYAHIHQTADIDSILSFLGFRIKDKVGTHLIIFHEASAVFAAVGTIQIVTLILAVYMYQILGVKRFEGFLQRMPLKFWFWKELNSWMLSCMMTQTKW